MSDDREVLDVFEILTRKVYAAAHRYGGCELTAEQVAVLAGVLESFAELKRDVAFRPKAEA